MASWKENRVQQKIPCIFEIEVKDENSRKRSNQSFRVLAVDCLNSEASSSCLQDAWLSEKLDGTCCYVSPFKGKPWLWARYDRKPNKIGERKFKKYQSLLNSWRKDGRNGDKPSISWDLLKDFKECPDNWIPALGVPVKDSTAQPDDGGHTPGWVPIDVKSRQHCWHLSAVDLIQSLALVLRENEDEGLTVECLPLSDLLGQTVELIGTNINGNPYHIGTKPQPIHVLVKHGSISVSCPPVPQLSTLTDWLQHAQDGQVEGVVWHCQNGKLFKDQHIFFVEMYDL
ncbi:uncharacterized protein C12orf29 homolog isoform X2 [Gigantopelta aegis]|uniref:uncharacterized protein C12orf29 homolog isoform X2 n=1 Tax=Gigantopelta aegis TaxID=1735272 RepID=UPI001B88D3FD|nr:uncharacterized protein C12orf29 homolog isoform X2 [Gigantopelta aegis]